ncbi:hypothetical protein AMTRI_Chr03g55490 [Amborella trichopoda]|uniref:DUF1764 domain-containing protein n=1 Tax=Amborella trichopoda TaxID=13333 RepID=W1NDS1_AMBTC|nr:uncharacterized protein C6G9.01c [Amborella trichopoda]ERM93493.1 hypothetical protein AMTR_s00004p00025720 [Amborella trichopoda]|eukprot:XP_006826256.1 uncharacterized protein C6G9.01c [Amborella trichopoda]
MAKKRSSETMLQSSPSEEKPKKTKKLATEIDEIFSLSKKKPKLENSPNRGETQEPASTEKGSTDTETKRVKSKRKENVKKEKIKKKKKDISSENGWVDPPSRSRRKTADGFTVYSAEELGFGEADAGGTPLCPFDCSCCF